MLRHIALFRWSPETTAEDVSRIEEALHKLPDRIPCIQSYRFGRDIGIQSGNADFALVADFADEASLANYANHPEHQAVLNTLIRPRLQQREAIQYIID